ncbi:MAG: CHAD domain-containing protein [Ginsengibacter sp.]
MKHIQIKNIIKKRYAGIKLLFEQVILHFNEEDIHLFRVEVKKLRAFMRLVSTVPDEEFEFKLPKKLNEFYHTLGVIRSLQIQKQHVLKVLEENHSVNPEIYLNLLTTMIANDIKLVTDLAEKKTPFDKGEEKVLRTVHEKLKKTVIREFTASKVKFLKELLKPLFLSDESLHSIRKILTDFVYTWSYINEEVNLIMPHGMFSTEEEIISVTQLLGDFEDICVCLHLLHAEHMDKAINENEDTLLPDIEKEWLKQKEIARDKIHKVFQTNISFNHKYPSMANGNQSQLADKVLSTAVY